MISQRLNSIGISKTMEVASKAIELKSAGVNLIDLSVGEPDFPTPLHIKDAAKTALDDDLTKYTQNNGTIELRNAIARKLKNDNGLTYSSDQIIVCTGAKQALFNAVQTLVDEGDEVILPTPAYVSYIQMVSFAGGKIKQIQTSQDSGFKLSSKDLSDVITNKTKLLILCNPCNPTGTVYSKQELTKIVDVILKNNLFVICDEIYEKLIYDDLQFTSIASLSEEIKERSVIVNGFSKAYSMTGWRIGYAAATKQIIANMSKLQSHSTSCTSSISQAAGLKALISDQNCVIQMRHEFENRRNLVFQEICSMDYLSAVIPKGAFYIFVNVSKLFGKSTTNFTIKNSEDLALFLLKEAKVVVVPGSGFEAEGYIRISFASSIENLKEGIRRIKSTLSNLQ